MTDEADEHSPVGVLGLGRMGSAIAERLLDAGYAVTVYNRDPAKTRPLAQRGARAVERAEELWEHADTCVSMLSDSAALTAVTLEGGLLGNGSTRRRVLIDMSTVSAAASDAVAERAEQAGIGYLRAPVSGNPGVVRAGRLAILVSGPEELYSDRRVLLEAIGPSLFYLGVGEQARVMKLCLNLMIAGTAELLAEAIALGEAHGLERAAILEVVSGSVMASPFVAYKTQALLAEDYATTFSTRLMRKDLDLALESGRDGQVPLPVTALVAQLLQGAMGQGMAELDFMALLPRLKREAGGA